MKKEKRLAVCVAAMILAVLGLSGCGRTRVVFTTGLSDKEVFRIGDEVCTLPEMIVYLTNVQNEYEKVYGDRIWESSHNGVTLEDNIKDTVLERLTRIKTMYLLAKEQGVELTAEEEKKVEEAGGKYFASLSKEEVEALSVDEALICQMYREYALAEKVYKQIIRDINPEISDDEARRITVEQIVILYDSQVSIPKADDAEEEGTDEAAVQENGTIQAADAQNQESNTQEERSAQVGNPAYNLAVWIRQMALTGTQSFEELAETYNQAEETTISFGKGEVEEALETAGFNLDTGGISQVIEGSDGYHIMKCISTFNREETDANKVKIVEKRRKEAFDQVYDSFVENLTSQMNEKLWEQIAFIRKEGVTTSDFFRVYAEYFT